MSPSSYVTKCTYIRLYIRRMSVNVSFYALCLRLFLYFFMPARVPNLLFPLFYNVSPLSRENTAQKYHLKEEMNYERGAKQAPEFRTLSVSIPVYCLSLGRYSLLSVVRSLQSIVCRQVVTVYCLSLCLIYVCSK